MLIKSFIVLIFTSLLIPVTVFGELADYCSSSEEIGSNGLWKWKASDHINPADPRAKGPSLICNINNKRCVKWPAKVFHCDGTQPPRSLMRKYGTWNGNGADRGYTYYGSSAQMKRQARAKSCTELYIQTEKTSPSHCYSVSIDLERNGDTF